MGIRVYSLFWVMLDLYHQPYSVALLVVVVALEKEVIMAKDSEN